ncbi:guanine nucleotide-binding protein subunit alpha [Acrasis kona]|uniref:Guanine nucleotide-binding protein subunit alpha n=1 Tax=Acrasis kona TaxID=1008807 RepID=A0AAW2Z9R9_9EUKA
MSFERYCLIVSVDTIEEFNPKIFEISAIQPTYRVVWKNKKDRICETKFVVPKGDKVVFFCSNKEYKTKSAKEGDQLQPKMIDFTILSRLGDGPKRKIGKGSLNVSEHVKIGERSTTSATVPTPVGKILLTVTTYPIQSLRSTSFGPVAYSSSPSMKVHTDLQKRSLSGNSLPDAEAVLSEDSEFAKIEKLILEKKEKAENKLKDGTGLFNGQMGHVGMSAKIEIFEKEVASIKAMKEEKMSSLPLRTRTPSFKLPSTTTVYVKDQTALYEEAQKIKERQLTSDEKRHNMILIGAMDTGKSTFMRQLVHLYGLQKNVEDPQTQIIYSNVLEAVQYMGELTLNHDFECSEDCKDSLRRILSVDCDITSADASFEEVYKDLRTVWNDDQFFDKWKDFYPTEAIPETAIYFLNRIDELSPKIYHPVHDDFVRMRGKTTGIVNQNIVNVCGSELSFNMFDCAGAKQERKKWRSRLASCEIALFFSSLIEYDKKSSDSSLNCNEDSLALYEHMCKTSVLSGKPILVVFTKFDLIKSKLERDGQDWDAFKAQLEDAFKLRSNDHVFLSYYLDTTNTKEVNSCAEWVIKMFQEQR